MSALPTLAATKTAAANPVISSAQADEIIAMLDGLPAGLKMELGRRLDRINGVADCLPHPTREM